MSDQGLRVTNLHASVAGKEILKGIDLTVEPGKVHALMGPNGSGKSTLAFALAGHPAYDHAAAPRRSTARSCSLFRPTSAPSAGLFLSFQYPAAIPGVTVANFLHAARKPVRPERSARRRNFRAMLFEKLDISAWIRRFSGAIVNDGFSGGEKKRLEMLQLGRPRAEVCDSR